ncbi:MAG: peptidyl-prolyl cis-trans isomerase [Lentisphaeria bacterium]|jgi:parvulin-like peptidyl-prolyl isomerase|nr:peptidyl-prolyl cis-trans isomerase [Lentisphaeria bacterium]
MLFQHINRHADKHRKRVYLVLVVIIGLSFVVWVTPRGCNDPGGPNAGRRIGKVFGKPVSQGEFLSASRRANLGNLISTGQFLGGGEGEEQLRALTMQRLMAMREARRLGIDAVSPEEFQAFVKKQFTRDGAFDAEQLTNFRNNITRSQGMTGAEFDLAFQENIVIARLEARATAGLVVSPAEVRDAFDQAHETFTVSYAEVAVDTAAKGEPADAELEAYFAAHQKDLRLPAGKVARVASLPIPADLSAVAIPEEKIKEQYERLKEGPYKEKTLDEVRAEIRERLAHAEVRVQTSTKVRLFLDELAKRPEGETQEALLERFGKLAESYGATVKDTPAIQPGDSEIPGFEGLRSLGGAVRSLAPEAPVSAHPLFGMNQFALLVLKEVIPGQVPETLAQVRDQVVEAVLTEKGKAFFAEKILPQADKVAGLRSSDELVRQELDKVKNLGYEEQYRIYFETLSFVKRFVEPGFKPEQRTAWIAEFSSANVIEQAAAKITAAQVEDFYKGSSEYHRPETRVSQILVTVPADADDETRAARRKLAEELLARVREKGEAFADVARTGSQDKASAAKGGDLGYAPAGQRPKEYEEALAKLEVGEMSDLVETRTGLAILMLTDRRNERPFDEDLAKEIRSRLEDQEARLIIQDQAAEFADEVAAACEKIVADTDAARLEASRKLFAELAAKKSIELIKVDTPFAQNESIGPRIGPQRDLSKAIFELDASLPFTAAVDGKTRQYVALLDSVDPGRFYDLEKEAEIVLPKLRQAARQEIAREAARAEAKALREAWLAALAEGKTLDKLAETEIKTTAPFSKMAPDQSLPNQMEVVKAVAGHASGTMLDLIEHDGGFMVARLDARTLPAEEAFTKEAREQQERQLLWAKSSAAINAYYKNLEAQAGLELFGQPFSLR